MILAMDSIAAATNPDSVEALREERTASSRSDAVQAGWPNIKSFFSRKLPWQPMLEQEVEIEPQKNQNDLPTGEPS